MNECVPDTSYFSTPECLSLILHCMSFIEIPIHLFGAYIIMFHTPSSMSSVKWPMMNVHFWSSFLDISISLLTIPYVIFPAVAGFPLGILKDFGVSTGAQVHFVVTLIGLVSVALVTVFSNRYYVMFGGHLSPLRRGFRVTFLSAAYILVSTFMIPFSLMIPEQKEAVRIVFERYPCLPDYVYQGPVFVYTLNITPGFITITILFLTGFTTVALFIFLILFNLFKQTRNVTFSPKTISLQKKFLAGLVIQTSIPIVMGIIPICYMAFVVPQGLYNQGLNNVAFIVMAFHGLLSTSVVLLAYHPYREATISILLPCLDRKVSRKMAVTTIISKKF